MFRFMLIVFSFLAFSANASEVANKIPSNFVGKWAPSQESCGKHPLTGDDYPELMTLSEDKIRYFESGGKVITLAKSGDDEVAAIFDFYSEDETFIYYKHFRLIENQKKLEDLIGFNEVVETYVRCKQSNLSPNK